MHRGEFARHVVGIDDPATLLGEPKRRTEKRSRRRRTEIDDQARPDRRNPGFRPRFAGANLDRLGFGVDAALAAFDELERAVSPPDR
jgi:hypothetical protein